MILTGIKPTGTMHLGNYLSTILPIKHKNNIILIADQHALISNKTNIKEYSNQLVNTFQSFGFTNIIRQSDIPEISELFWILSNFVKKGYLDRNHSVKTKTDYSLSLFLYPVLMAADLAIFDTDFVSIGKDQVSHIETAKNIIKKFNNVYNTDILKIPEPLVNNVKIKGFDGNKMSKSNKNIIPLFCSEKQLRKHIFRIKTNSKNIGEPKFFDESPVCELYSTISDNSQIDKLKEQMKQGISWSNVKDTVFDKINEQIKYQRIIYNDLEIKNNIKPEIDKNILKNVKEKIKIIKEIIY